MRRIEYSSKHPLPTFASKYSVLKRGRKGGVFLGARNMYIRSFQKWLPDPLIDGVDCHKF